MYVITYSFFLSSMLVQAKNSKGFTLVELIVVITILAILATIGFLSLQGYTSDAKDAKVRANIRTVTSALVNEQAMSSNTISTYIDSNATAVTAYSICSTGTGAAYSGTAVIDLTGANAAGNYFVGEIKPSALRIDATKFFDTPNTPANASPKPFAIGAYNLSEVVNGKTRVRPLFQVAGTIKGSSQSAVVEGNYGTGAATDVPGLIKSSVAGATTITPTGSMGAKAVVINGSTTNIPYDLN